MHGRKRLDCPEEIDDRNMHVGDSSESSKKVRRAVEKVSIILENICVIVNRPLVQQPGVWMSKLHVVKALEGKDEHVIGHGGKDEPGEKWQEADWIVLCCWVELGYLGEEISKQSVEGAAWFLFPAYSKMWERDKWRNESLSRKEPELDDWRDSQCIISQKLIKHALERIPRVWLDNLLVRLSTWLMDPSKHLSRTRSRDGIIQEQSMVNPHV